MTTTPHRERLPATTVVIACHRLENLPAILRTVESVQRQTSPAAACVVAVDHNDALADALRGAVEATVVENTGPHRGASATRNAGAAVAVTDVIAFLDDDEIAADTWLERLLPSLDDPTVVGTGGRYVPQWEDGRPSWFPDELAWVVGGHHSGQPVVQAPVRNVWSGNMAVRTTVFRDVDGFRLGFGKSGATSRPEDTDLCIRMAQSVAGGRWIYVPDAQIAHAVPPDRATFAFYVRRCYAEGRGKVELQAALGDVDALATERDYLRRTIPRGIAQHLADAAVALARGARGRDAVASLSRAAAVVVGVGAAAVGGLRSTLARRPHPLPADPGGPAVTGRYDRVDAA